MTVRVPTSRKNCAAGPPVQGSSGSPDWTFLFARACSREEVT